MTYEEEFRPASLGRYCLRELEMEAVNDRLLEGAMEILLREYWHGQPFLPMWLPEYPPTILPRLTCPRRRLSIGAHDVCES
jgi:hypothetical protein